MIRQLNSIDSYELAIARPGAFTGGSGERGDKDTASGVTTLFEVTGDVAVRIFGVSALTPVGAATIEVGVTGNTAALLAQITDATTFATNEIWVDATPTTLGVDLLASVLGPYMIVNGMDIQEKIGTADITAGNIYYVCLWTPLSPGSKVKSLY